MRVDQLVVDTPGCVPDPALEDGERRDDLHEEGGAAVGRDQPGDLVGKRGEPGAWIRAAPRRAVGEDQIDAGTSGSESKSNTGVIALTVRWLWKSRAPVNSASCSAIVSFPTAGGPYR